MIKRCNDFGAGGVSVAIGELADGLDIYLDRVPKKYEGLDGTELAISESQERMAVALAPDDVDDFIALARAENLEATPVAVVTEEPRVRMDWRGKTIVDVSREFLASNGAPKFAQVSVPGQESFAESAAERAFEACDQLTDPVVDAVCEHDSIQDALVAHALRRRASADTLSGHGGEAAGVGREHHHGFRLGLGLQSLSL